MSEKNENWGWPKESAEKSFQVDEEEIHNMEETIAAARNPREYFQQMKNNLDEDPNTDPSETFTKIFWKLGYVNFEHLQRLAIDPQPPFDVLADKNKSMTERRKSMLAFVKELGFEKDVVRTWFLNFYEVVEDKAPIINTEKLDMRGEQAEILELIDEVYGE